MAHLCSQSSSFSEQEEEQELDVTNENVSSYQMIHMRLGHVTLGIIISIPRNELPNFKADGNKLYLDLLKLIDGRLSQILQREQNRKVERSKKGEKHQLIKGATVKFACSLERHQDESNYCFVQDTNPKSNPKTNFAECVVSPLCLSVYAVSAGGYLPFGQCGDVIISSFYQPEMDEKGMKRNRK